ncbi:hypothetical protein ACFOZY_06895 [Chungangia koreensis]|uniref:TspO and MBR related proteins n=1 Tax=Chungangia koreensis TaxID=752657 RepID=A0ABV8X3S5_9LACT
MPQILLMSIMLILLAAFNLAADLFKFNGHTTAELTNWLPVLITPVVVTYAIWIVLYALLAVWIYRLYKKRHDQSQKLTMRSILFSISCLLTITWNWFFHFELYFWTIIFQFAQLLSIFALYLTYGKLKSNWQDKLPISVFFSWSIMVCMFNVALALTYFEWSGWGISDPLWTVIFLTVAAAIALHFRYHYHDIAIVVIFVWTFLGIVLQNGIDELLVSAASLFLCGVMIFGILFIKKEA